METDRESGRPLQKMFMAVPPSYDLLNRLLTFRFDERWRKKAARVIMNSSPQNFLDLCTGTGDLAIRLRRVAPHTCMVTALDYSEPMLEVARGKAGRLKLNGIDFVWGDVADLPFKDNMFDAIGIAFAFRNLTFRNPDTAVFLTEILRVLRPGGHFVIVETSQPKARLIRSLVHVYLRHITVPVGALISGHRGAYRYLAHSAINYYDADGVRQLLLDAGFSEVAYQLQLGGVASIWKATK